MDLSKRDSNAINMIVTALKRAHFYHIEGDEVSNLEQSRLLLINLKSRIDKELMEREAKVIAQAGTEAKQELDKNKPPKDPVKPMSHDNSKPLAKAEAGKK